MFNRGFKSIFVTLAIIIIVVVLHQWHALVGIENLFVRASAPLIRTFYEWRLQSGNWWQSTFQPSQLRQENQQLTEMNIALQQQLIELDNLRQENQQLKKLVDYQQPSVLAGVAALILTKRDSLSRFYFLIDKGQPDGVKVGNLVVDEYGQLLGDIAEANKSFSIVRPIVDPEFKIGVRYSTGSQTLGVVQGVLSVSLRVDLIPAEQPLAIGDFLVTDSIVDIPLGKIGAIEKRGSEPFQSAIVVPLTDFSQVLAVTVINEVD